MAKLQSKSQSPESLVTALSPFSTCDIADALAKLDHPDGGYLAGLALWSPEFRAGAPKVIGPAYTVQYVRHNAVNAPKLPHYIDTIPPGAVVFISSPPNAINSVYGGLMTARAKASGAVGTIVDGRIRDLQEHRDQNYPVFARDVGTTAFYQAMRVDSIGTPVRLQSLEQNVIVNPGDILVGDLNGVVCIPRGLVEQVLGILPGLVAADAKVRKDLEAGEKFLVASSRHRNLDQ